MKWMLAVCLLTLLSQSTLAQNTEESRITSIVDSSQTDNLVLIQSFEVKVPIDSVWNAYTTVDGWQSWATAIAKLDFRIGGTIKTNYNKDGKIGDESTITLHVVNYVPMRMITLQAELTKNFPEFMQEDSERLFNTILFESIDPSTTKVTSFGIGYQHNEKYLALMEFFIKGNAQSYLNLITYLESGEPSVNY